ncbi:hypothetical protein F4810DRAFT_691931 [Camillea tinctor]|nr:hypothetical protein F4810DRAFT_691931 [Camillea tinctor]
MPHQLSIQIPSRTSSPTPTTTRSHKSLQRQFADILIRVTGSPTKPFSTIDNNDDDACSSYDENENENEHEDRDLEPSASAPETTEKEAMAASYAEFAALNPYRARTLEENEAAADVAVRQTITIMESHDEALLRLSSQLDSVHELIKAEECAALRFLQRLSPETEGAKEEEN